MTYDKLKDPRHRETVHVDDLYATDTQVRWYCDPPPPHVYFLAEESDYRYFPNASPRHFVRRFYWWRPYIGGLDSGRKFLVRYPNGQVFHIHV